jgi:signal transduction histidine kinase
MGGFVAVVYIVGYAFGVDEFFNATLPPVSAPSALALALLCLGLLAARPDSGIAQIAAAHTVGGAVLRNLLPVAVLAPILLGWLRLAGERSGLFDTPLGLSLMVLTFIVLFTGMVLWLSGSLHQTDLRRGEAQRSLQRTNQHLLVEIEQRKAAQAQMIQSEKLAALGQLVAGVAHEINNPLSFVANNLAVLQRDSTALAQVLGLYRQADPALREARPELHASIAELSGRVDLPYALQNLQGLLCRSREGLRRIEHIVRDLRDFARSEQRQLCDVDLAAEIQSTVNIVGGQARRKRVRIELELQAIPPVLCYPGKINQALLNLLTNAIDASPEAGVVWVRSSLRGDLVCVEVTDSGPGVPPELRHRIFDPFFTTKPMGQGLGLGLSIAYTIMQDHGGRIEVDSSPGGGARFRLLWPMKSAGLSTVSGVGAR